ncbi:hypothetical protein D3C84_1113980 [compost metagenome]
MAGPVAPSGGDGKVDRNHSRIVSVRMIVPTRWMKIQARSYKPSSRLRGFGQR